MYLLVTINILRKKINYLVCKSLSIFCLLSVFISYFSLWEATGRARAPRDLRLQPCKAGAPNSDSEPRARSREPPEGFGHAPAAAPLSVSHGRCADLRKSRDSSGAVTAPSCREESGRRQSGSALPSARRQETLVVSERLPSLARKRFLVVGFRSLLKMCFY